MRAGTPTLLVEASLWPCDLTRLGAEVQRLEPHVDALHFDTGDGQMPGRLMFFPAVLAALRPAIRRPVHVHVMAWWAQRLAMQWVEVGADMITVHVDANDTATTLSTLRRDAPHVQAGLALPRSWPVETVEPLLDQVNLVLTANTALDAVDAALDHFALTKVRELCRLVARRHPLTPVVAEGGVNAQTVAALSQAGVGAVVASSLLSVPTEQVEDHVAWIADGGRGPLPAPPWPRSPPRWVEARDQPPPPHRSR